MPYLDTYQQTLTAENATHLLRRATFGPTKQEIASFTGLTAVEAVNRLIANVSVTIAPPPPVDFDDTKPTAGRPFLSLPLDKTRASAYSMYIRYWWLGLMLEQNNRPSVLEKLTAFWQNHFVVTQAAVPDYRVSDHYLRTLRNNCLGSFRSLVVMMTKDAGMLIFQNGNENQKGRPNENYARELQELFVVGAKNFSGGPNYTEDDVKAAAKVLTGWQVKNYWVEGSTSFEVTYDPNRHDTTDKTFSSYYGNKVITGRTGETSGDTELNELVNMLLAHPESAKFICRKLYRWYVNTDVSQEIEDNVIIPLAQFFASPSNDFKIQPVLQKLLESEIFYDSRNRGALIKSPLEWIVGNLKFFNQPVPSLATDYLAFRNYIQFAYSHLTSLQYLLLVQPTVFGYVPYYQTGYSENWINGTSIGRRHFIVDRLIYPTVEIKPGYVIGLDLVAWITARQENFSDVTGTPAITSEQVLDSFTEHLFALNLGQADKDFLIDTIMMRGIPRTSWIREWNNYRGDPGNIEKKKAVLFRFNLLMRHLLRMAEYQIF